MNRKIEQELGIALKIAADNLRDAALMMSQERSMWASYFEKMAAICDRIATHLRVNGEMPPYIENREKPVINLKLKG